MKKTEKSNTLCKMFAVKIDHVYNILKLYVFTIYRHIDNKKM